MRARYANWSFTKIARPYKFTWDKEYSVKTVIVLFDGSQSFTIDPTTKMQDGIDFEKTEPRKITLKDAQDLKLKGAYVFKIDADGNFDTISIRYV